MHDAVTIAKGRQEEIAAENRRLDDFLSMADQLVKGGRLEGEAPPAEAAPAKPRVTAATVQATPNGDSRNSLFARRVAETQKSDDGDTLSLRN